MQRSESTFCALARGERLRGSVARGLVLWTLTVVEITSALWRLVREGALIEGDAGVAEQRAAELAAASRVVVDVDSVKAYAQRLLRVYTLRAADAVQLGAALVWANGRPEGRSLCTLDDRLALAAQRERFRVVLGGPRRNVRSSPRT